MSQEEVYIVAAKRTAIGAFLGTLAEVPAHQLAVAVAEDVIKSAGMPKSCVQEVILGQVLTAGTAQSSARQVLIHSGIPETANAYQIGMVCGSGLKSVMAGTQSIRTGDNDVVLAGGMESMSNAPMLLSGKARSGIKFGHQTLLDHLISEGLWDAYGDYHMGITAENIVEKYSISREEQDLFAYQSQQKALKAQKEGAFDKEITPIEVKLKRESIRFQTDEYVNAKTTPEKLATLKPAFKAGGTVTAGNASGINDGAALLLLASKEAVKAHNLKPIARIVAHAQAGIDPAIMGMAVVPATNLVLKKAAMALSDIGLFEFNEAFAAQSLGVIKELSRQHTMDENDLLNRTNIQGGAIALGHPIGASGSRILVTLLHALERAEKRWGLASLCIGGGQSVAVIVEKL